MTYISNRELLQTWDLYFIALRNNTNIWWWGGGGTKCKFLHNVALGNDGNLSGHKVFIGVDQMCAQMCRNTLKNKGVVPSAFEIKLRP